MACHAAYTLAASVRLARDARRAEAILLTAAQFKAAGDALKLPLPATPAVAATPLPAVTYDAVASLVDACPAAKVMVPYTDDDDYGVVDAEDVDPYAAWQSADVAVRVHLARQALSDAGASAWSSWVEDARRTDGWQAARMCLGFYGALCRMGLTKARVAENDVLAGTASDGATLWTASRVGLVVPTHLVPSGLGKLQPVMDAIEATRTHAVDAARYANKRLPVTAVKEPGETKLRRSCGCEQASAAADCES